MILLHILARFRKINFAYCFTWGIF